MTTLKSGMVARFDTFSGLIPCKVLAIRNADYGVLATVQISRTVQAYKRGDIIETHARYAIPVACVRRRKYSTRLLPFDVIVDVMDRIALPSRWISGRNITADEAMEFLRRGE